MEINLIKASVDDCQSLAEMNKRLILDEGHSNRMNIQELKERMINFINNEYKCYLIQLNQENIGYCLFRDDVENIYIRQIYVKDNFRKQGYARKCLEELSEIEWKGKKLRIEVLSHNLAGINFWRKLGFKDYCIIMERN